jgi:predicted TIM-barrel fold metal-dependent hydrolase
VNNKGRLLADWNKLIKQYPDRFMIGSDPFWPVEKEIAMEEPDSGWLYVKDYLNFHRKWLAELPEKTRRKLEYDNAVKFFASSDK